jgi:putative ABC transport system permease protein
VNAVEPAVVGLIDAGRKDMDVKFVAVPLALAQRLRNTKNVSLYSVLRHPSQAAAFSRGLEAAARARGLALEAMPWEEHVMGEQYRAGMQVLAVFRGLMAVVVISIVGMAVFTTMAKSVSERTREVGRCAAWDSCGARCSASSRSRRPSSHCSHPASGSPSRSR